MYVPKHFADARPEALCELIRSHPFGTLVTMADEALDANHIPFVLKPDPAPYGTLQGHLARANEQWKSFRPDVDALVVFHGPDSYISPSWYPTKQETGRVVPTWNYVVVHAYGRLRVVDDRDWLKTHVEELTDQQEQNRQEAWRVADAPIDFTEKLIRAIVGVEIEISRVVAKRKLGQNRPPQDRMGITEGLSKQDDPSARSMVRYLKEHRNE